MTRTTTRMATRAARGVRRTSEALPTDATSDVTRGAARRAVNEAGRRVLGAVVDRAVTRVEGVADRLDGVAESGTGLRSALTGKPAAARADRKDGEAAEKSGPMLGVRVGAAFSLVVYRAVQVLQFLQRLAVQLLEALRNLVGRPRPAAAEPAGGADEDGPQEAAAGGESEPGDPRTRRSEASGPQPIRSVPAGPARRGRPRPASRPEGRGRGEPSDRGE